MGKEELIFLDESGINLTRTRTHARAPLGKRAYVPAPFHHGSHIAVIRALGVPGICAPMRIEGALTTEGFESYVPHLLVPCLRPGHRVLRANVKFHSAPQALELIAAAGAQVGHLPAYSPDFNPLEGCIAKLKPAGRSFKARTKRKLAHALAKALTWITQQDIHGGFEHAGSVSSLK